jgi:NAD-dependent SIR2 family protein deacetylase
LEIAKTKRNYFVFTSNVDGQFQKAGFDDDLINEVHGSIHHLQCSKNCTSRIWSAGKLEIDVNENTLDVIGDLPKCPFCGSVARPNILMFDDYAWNPSRRRMQESRLESWFQINATSNNKIVVLEIGAGNEVPTVRMKSIKVSSACNAKHIRINPMEQDIHHCDIAIASGAKDAINIIYQQIMSLNST